MESNESSVDKTLSRLEDQLALWNAKLNDLVARVEVAGQQTKIDARKHLDEVKSQLDVARSRLEEAKTAGGDRWDKFKGGVESTWKDLERAFHKLTH